VINSVRGSEETIPLVRAEEDAVLEITKKSRERDGEVLKKEKKGGTTIPIPSGERSREKKRGERSSHRLEASRQMSSICKKKSRVVLAM